MSTDKDPDAIGIDPVTDTEEVEDLHQSTLEWLLDLDMSEPQERLFALESKEYIAEELSAYEAEVAARPMTRGKAGADDFGSYVAEEIVISSESQSSDIYGTAASSEPEHDAAGFRSIDTMAIDYSRSTDSGSTPASDALAEGLDILGLSAEDDIGEKYLVLKRVKAGADQDSTAAGIDAEHCPPPTESLQLEQMPPREQPMLSKPPVLRLVSARQPGAVSDSAATQSVSTPSSDAVDDSAGVTPGNIFGYVASVQPPADADEFDNYLLSGEKIGDADQVDPRIEELLEEHGPGVVPVDSSPEESIDYHDDFRVIPGFEAVSVGSISRLFPQLMGEATALVAARLADLQLDQGSVRIELMLGGDVESVEACMAAGFEPLQSLCIPPPAALQQLRQAEVDAVFARLVRLDSGEGWNDLFAEDAMVPIANTTDVFGALLAGEELDVELDTQLAGMAPQQGEEDIAAIFADLEQEFDDIEIDSGTVPLAPPISADIPPDLPMQIFGEDIFGENFDDEFVEIVTPVAGTIAAQDIDGVFDAFEQPDQPGVVVWGLGVDEFPAADNPSALLPGLEPDVPDSNPEPEGMGTAASPWFIPQDIVFSHTSQGGTEIFSDFLDAFVEEGSSELEKLEDAVGEWEQDIGSDAVYARITRILHTIKGIAKGVGLHYYGTLIHNFETLLEGLPKPQADSQAEYFRIVNIWLDAAVRGLDHIQTQRADLVSEFPQPAGWSQKAAVAAAADVDPMLPAEAAPPQAKLHSRQLSKQEADEGARILAGQQSVRITSDKLDHLLNLANQAQQLGVRTAQSSARSRRSSAEMKSRLASVRAHIASIADRGLRNTTAFGQQQEAGLDALEMDQYSELQEAASILREGVEDLADLVDFASRQNAQIEALLKQQAGVISSVGTSLRAARVVPVSRLVPGLRRLVRTVSTDLGKSVSLQVLNELGTLDRDDFGRCQNILDHMVRNALDHGIEAAAIRQSRGKPASGQVTLDIRKAGADAIITLTDDGSGIDPATIRESARRKGLDVDVDALSDAEALRLIFHKGFSTAGTLSQISGRGVGMDIVLNEIQQMGGDIQLESTVGRGTTFHIRIPSSVTVNGALLVAAGDQSYAIPLGCLVAVEHVSVDDFYTAVNTGTTLRLAGLVCEPGYLATLCQGRRLPEKKVWGATMPVLIAGGAERFLAIAIDSVEEALELVIRSMGVQFSSVPGVAGAATTADGKAIVALDLNMLVATVGTGDQSSAYLSPERDESLLVLVVDDSRTQRLVATSQLETVGVETITAENGAVAIDLLHSADRLPDIILLDVEMPVKDGIQTLHEIRKSVRCSHIPVIMVTSRTGLKHRALAESAGCNGYMGKPFNFSMLIGQINELTGHRLQLS